VASHSGAILLRDNVGVADRDRPVRRAICDWRNRTRKIAPDFGDSFSCLGGVLLYPIESGSDLSEISFQSGDAIFKGVCHQLVSLGA
jgi:hypothetical protein